jgi:hypothetical protein
MGYQKNNGHKPYLVFTFFDIGPFKKRDVSTLVLYFLQHARNFTSIYI